MSEIIISKPYSEDVELRKPRPSVRVGVGLGALIISGSVGFLQGKTAQNGECQNNLIVPHTKAFGLSQHEINLGDPDDVLRAEPGIQKELNKKGIFIVQADILFGSIPHTKEQAALYHYTESLVSVIAIDEQAFHKQVYFTTGRPMDEKVPQASHPAIAEPAVAEIIITSYSC